MIRSVETFRVQPALPDPVKGLVEIAYNLHWAWRKETVELFRRLDREAWETSGHNPVLMLGTMDQQRLDRLPDDDGFMAHLERVHHYLQDYLKAETWYEKQYGKPASPLVAYFSMEFGLTDCLPIYSGGLGILAGDHLKSASELGVPLAGVGLMYRQGYFQQYLNEDGWQQEFYPDNDFYNLPVRLETGADGAPVTVAVPMADREVLCRIWRADVGRVPLYLLDTGFSANSPADRTITLQLYGGDQETRIQQEIVLGIGGMRALRQLGVCPTVCHMNEGHSGFLALERILYRRETLGLSNWEASELTGCGTLFTTHTPVPAGIDEFPPDLMARYFKRFFPEDPETLESFLSWGRRHRRAKPDEPFNMAIMALRFADFANGVSRLHGRVSRKMWQVLWPGVPEEEVPIDHVTNGVHIHSWISSDMAGLFDRYLGPGWAQQPADQELWAGVDGIPDEELWRTHERRRERLVAFTRRRLREQLQRRGAPSTEVEAAGGALNHEALTIGFARRFATYKRATLLLEDEARLSELLRDEERPLQIIFAGKAHPRDDEGKNFIRQIIAFARKDTIRRRVVFLENYDMNVARYMVQGVDVWLNTPRRPLEASGTSGMKVCANGGLNLSILDGWWDEGYAPARGWSIGLGEEFGDWKQQDALESRSLFHILESELLPLFYERGADGLPRRWLAKVKASMRELSPAFSADRMVREYTERFYVPALERWRRMEVDNAQPARDFAAWRVRVTGAWDEVRVTGVQVEKPAEIQVGTELRVTAEAHLGQLTPADVSVEIYTGSANSEEQIGSGAVTAMVEQGESQPGAWSYSGTIACTDTGLRGVSVRIMPHHEMMAGTHDLGLVRWADA